ncbi:DUF7601 domain-containing protein [Gudongella sp. DL1XJH-153]|uniref:DUF7601 domain-containing protein n=1 Tax=Gudongella sp. DL1XJH-153 TaxID=3409804 RepID=UPI003BB4B463
MMGKYRKLLTFLIALSMILSMHVSFAVQGGGNLDLEDPYVELAKFEWKGNSWKAEGSSNGITVTGSAIEVEFESDDYPIYAVVIKGGTDNDVIYFDDGVYSGSFDNSDLSNPSGEPDLSNITFYTKYVGEIEIEKIVTDEDDEVIQDDDTKFKFKVEMKVEGEWGEIDDSPVILTGNDSDTLTGLSLGMYRVTEIDIDSDYTLDTDNELEIELKNNGDSKYVSFTNIMDTPEDGSLRIIKSVETPGQASEIIDSTEFSFIVEMYDEDAKEWVELEDSPFAVAGGSSLDLDLPLGKYRITEESEFGYRLDSENELEVELTEEEPADSVLFTNVKIPDGMLTIIKSIVTPGQASEIVDSTEFSFIVEMYDEDAEEWVELEDSPFVVAGGSSLDLVLPLGEYRVTEESKTGYILNGENGLKVELTENEPEDSVLFENMKVPQGSIEISKILVDEDDEEIDDDTTEFEFKIEMMVEEDEETSWVEIDESTVLLEGGESETLTGLPLGEYRVTEINIPEGYMLHSESENEQETKLENDGDMGEAIFTNVREEDTPPPELGEIEVTKIVQNSSGNNISRSTRFYFELQVQGEGGWVTIDDGFIDGNGSLTFEDLEDGLYRVREVSINSAFRLFSDNNVEAEILESSSEEVEFINRLRPPRDDDDDDEEEDDDDEPEEDDDEEVLTIDTEPTPQLPPVIVVEQQPEPEQEPEVEVVEEETPQATLPATGASDPTVFAGFGAAFMALGLYLKKKRF